MEVEQRMPVKEEKRTEPADVGGSEEVEEQYTTDFTYKHEYVWPLVVGHAFLQLGALIGAYTAIYYMKWQTFVWAFTIGFLSGQGVAVGAHRGFSHKSFKATKPLEIALIFFHTMSGQNSLFTWVRDHKLHHKYSDTDVDPHNSSRGFFFAHMGWLMVRKHPLIIKKQREVDMSEIMSNKLIMFQHKHFLPVYFVIGFLIPVIVPMYFFGETFWTSFFVAYCMRYVLVLHFTWTINSAAHMFGNKPYDRRIKPVQSLITMFVTMGDGWHNFHHTFPWDYKSAEAGQMYGASATLIKILEYVGLAYDLKSASPDMVYRQMVKHGDETSKDIIAKRHALRALRDNADDTLVSGQKGQN